jgi:uncharacterized lipoprotein YbaY
VFRSVIIPGLVVAALVATQQIVVAGNVTMPSVGRLASISCDCQALVPSGATITIDYVDPNLADANQSLKSGSYLINRSLRMPFSIKMPEAPRLGREVSVAVSISMDDRLIFTNNTAQLHSPFSMTHLKVIQVH